MLHQVSVPSAAGIIPEATAAALPALDHHGIRVVSHGFFVILSAEFSQLHPIANSSKFSLPILDIQASFKFLITVASYGGTKFSSILEDAVVGTPFSQKTSLTQIGTHASGRVLSVALNLSFTKLNASI